MNPMPAYKPRNPIVLGDSYSKMVAAYGKPPKGYRWLEEGEQNRVTDIFCDMYGWNPADPRAELPLHMNDSVFPFARRIEGTKIVAPLEKFLSRTIFLDHGRDSTRLKPALKALTDSEIDDGAYSAQTVLDLRDALREAIRLLEKR